MNNFITLFVVPVIFSGGLSDEFKNLFVSLLIGSFCILGWGMFFEFLFNILKRIILKLKDKFKGDSDG